MQEGMCKNCGSIVYVDPKQENCHCLFCDCVFSSQEALDIVKHPQDFEFPNEEQPEYVGEEINPQHTKINANLEKLNERKNKKTKTKPKPKYAIERKELPDINLSKKQVFTLLGIIIAIVGVFLLITLPLTSRRDNQRAEITELLKADLSDDSFVESLDFDEGFAISRMRNSYVNLITENNLTKEDARSIFQIYCEIRADVMNIDQSDVSRAYNEVELRISMLDEGGYLIKNKNMTDLENLDVIKELE